jgi:hypothetical protein
VGGSSKELHSSIHGLKTREVKKKYFPSRSAGLYLWVCTSLSLFFGMFVRLFPGPSVRLSVCSFVSFCFVLLTHHMHRTNSIV